MHNPLVVCHGQRFGDGDPDLQNFVQRQRSSTEALRESFPFQKLHHQIVIAVLRTDVVKVADMRMVERGNGPSFAFHALLQFRRRRKMGSENLNGDGSIQAGVPGAIYLAHASGPQRRLDLIRPEFHARGKGHGWATLYVGPALPKARLPRNW